MPIYTQNGNRETGARSISKKISARRYVHQIVAILLSIVLTYDLAMALARNTSSLDSQLWIAPFPTEFGSRGSRFFSNPLNFPGRWQDQIVGVKRLHNFRRLSCKAAVEWVESLHGIVIGVGVGLPCTVMKCGDVVYRSTLPKSGLQITAPRILLALSVAAYLWATPGVAPGFWDMFLLAPLEQLLRPTYAKDDFVLGKTIGEGAFGTVYKASYADKEKDDPLVVKKANEYGEVEAWMNERVRRACAASCADYIYGFLENSSKKNEFWLVWRYEGHNTLSDLMISKDFPYNRYNHLFERNGKIGSFYLQSKVQRAKECLESATREQA